MAYFCAQKYYSFLSFIQFGPINIEVYSCSLYNITYDVLKTTDFIFATELEFASGLADPDPSKCVCGESDFKVGVLCVSERDEQEVHPACVDDGLPAS